MKFPTKLLLSAPALAGLAALALSVPAPADDTRLIVAANLTEAGRQQPAPAPNRPIYYAPVFAGYSESGPVLNFYERRPASDTQIRQQLTSALASQGFVLAPDGVAPSQVITFRWGTIAPAGLPRGSELSGSGGEIGIPPTSTRVLNSDVIHATLLGPDWVTVNRREPGADELLSLAPHHYLVISASDYRAYTQKKDVPLWQAHVSTNVWGRYLDQVIGTLIAAAEPRLGREMKPTLIWGSPAATVNQTADRADALAAMVAR